MKHPALFSAAIALLVAGSASANTPPFETLEQFCLATKADTAENCACGQAKADTLLTPDEQQLVIGMMSNDPAAMGQLMQRADKGRALMEKVQEITKGCN